MRILSSPGSIHAAYNPVLFSFEADTGEMQNFAGNRSQIAVAIHQKNDAVIVAELSIYFHQQKASVDLCPVLGSLFTQPVSTLNSSVPCLVDDAQSFQYSVLFNHSYTASGESSYNDGYDTLFTALRPAVQISQTHGMEWAYNRFLTPFNQQYKYPSFPLDVSVLVRGERQMNHLALTNGRINRVLVQTNNDTVLTFE